MAYIGYNPSQLAVAPFAVKSFTGDGSTTTFTLDQSVPGANEANVEVVVENVQQNPIDAYTIGGALNNSLIFSEAPVSGAAIYVIHKGESTYNLQPSTGSVTAATLDPVLRNFTVNNFTGDGSTTSFTLTDTPYSANSILVTVDGIVQTASTNYTVSGTTLSFGSSAPDSGAVITVVHMGFSSGNKTVIDGGITPVKLSTGGPWWTSDGNVGIGNTAPATKLDIGSLVDTATAATYGGTLRISSATQTTVNAVGGIELPVAGDGYGYKIQQISNAGANLAFANRYGNASWTERMRIDTAGKLMLATSTSLAGWSTGWYGIQFPNANISGAANQIDIAQNMYLNSSTGSWTTMATGPSAFAQIDNGAFYWQTAASASAGTLVTPNVVMSVSNTGLLTLPYGQIKFPAAQNASSDANTLDDYEEGTFSPSITFGGNSVGVTYNGRAGIYTKIGRNVYYSFGMGLSSKGSSTGSVAIAGFPYASGTGKSYREEGTRCGQYAGVSSDMTLWVQNGTTSFIIIGPSTGAGLTDTSFTNSSSVFFCGYYVTD